MQEPSAAKTRAIDPAAATQILAEPGGASTIIVDAAQGPAIDGDARIGAVLKGTYQLERRLGAGGMGAVYLAEHVAIRKKVAIKILGAEYAHRPEVKQRFLREARAAAAISDDHVIEIHDFGETPDGAAFFVMEYLQGEDLAALIEREAPLPWPRAREITLQICRALQAAHERGIVHRDMKPGNCFRVARPDGRDAIKVLDFGIAKVPSVDAGQALTRTGMIFGTPEYMSPEQAQGAPHDHRVDIYAAGVILFELLSGRPPFAADNFMGLLNKHMFEAPPRPSELAPAAAIPPAAEAVVLKALQKDPALRFQSMAELADAVLAVDAGVAPQVVAESLPTPPARGAPMDFRAPTLPPDAPRHGHARLVLVAAAVGAVIAAATIVLLSDQGASDMPPGPGPSAQVVAPPPVAAPPVAPDPVPAPPAIAPTVGVRIDTGGVVAQVLDEDGASLGSTAAPDGLRVPQGTAARRLVVRADGYEDAALSFVPSEDRTLRAELVRRAEPAKSGKPRRPGKPPPPTGSTGSTGSTAKPVSPDLIPLTPKK